MVTKPAYEESQLPNYLATGDLSVSGSKVEPGKSLKLHMCFTSPWHFRHVGKTQLGLAAAETRCQTVNYIKTLVPWDPIPFGMCTNNLPEGLRPWSWIMAALGQVLKFKHCMGEQTFHALHIWRIHETSQAPTVSTKMLLSQQKYTLKDSTTHSIHFAILNCLHVEHHGAAEHQDMVFTLESISERFTHVALPEESRAVRFDPIV